MLPENNINNYLYYKYWCLQISVLEIPIFRLCWAIEISESSYLRNVSQCPSGSPSVPPVSSGFQPCPDVCSGSEWIAYVPSVPAIYEGCSGLTPTVAQSEEFPNK